MHLPPAFHLEFEEMFADFLLVLADGVSVR